MSEPKPCWEARRMRGYEDEPCFSIMQGDEEEIAIGPLRDGEDWRRAVLLAAAPRLANALERLRQAVTRHLGAEQLARGRHSEVERSEALRELRVSWYTAEDALRAAGRLP